MNQTILNGIFALSGTLLGGIISFFIQKNEKETQKLKYQLNLLSKQVISYWYLEKLYSEEIAKLISKPSKTVLQDYRDKIENMDLERPIVTAHEAKNILNKNS